MPGWHLGCVLESLQGLFTGVVPGIAERAQAKGQQTTSKGFHALRDCRAALGAHGQKRFKQAKKRRNRNQVSTARQGNHGSQTE